MVDVVTRVGLFGWIVAMKERGFLLINGVSEYLISIKKSCDSKTTSAGFYFFSFGSDRDLFTPFSFDSSITDYVPVA
jgi:hypothetical protein